mgnify:CR=1 FL=1
MLPSDLLLSSPHLAVEKVSWCGRQGRLSGDDLAVLVGEGEEATRGVVEPSSDLSGKAVSDPVRKRSVRRAHRHEAVLSRPKVVQQDGVEGDAWMIQAGQLLGRGSWGLGRACAEREAAELECAGRSGGRDVLGQGGGRDCGQRRSI